MVAGNNKIKCQYAAAWRATTTGQGRVATAMRHHADCVLASAYLRSLWHGKEAGGGERDTPVQPKKGRKVSASGKDDAPHTWLSLKKKQKQKPEPEERRPRPSKRRGWSAAETEAGREEGQHANFVGHAGTRRRAPPELTWRNVSATRIKYECGECGTSQKWHRVLGKIAARQTGRRPARSDQRRAGASGRWHA